MLKIVKLAGAGIAAATLPTAAALADWEINMPVGVTPLSRDIHSLHMLIFWICVAIAVVVFGAMIYSIVRFRHSQGAVPAKFDHSTRAEIVWTIIPIIILISMAIPATETLIRIEDTSGSKLTVLVTGYQWKWHYNYVDQNVSFYSTLARKSNEARQIGSGANVSQVPNYLLDVDHPLVVPVNTKVRVLLTAGDVIHAWWVPAFGMKKDAIPGFVNELWFEAEKVGIYRGQCAELCGRDHGFMPVVVDVRTQQDFESWLQEQQSGSQGGQTSTPAATTAQSKTNATNAAVASAE